MKLLTIVIPSYNTESFIDKNMKTFIDERLFEKVEILIVNDGSNDHTAELASKYEEDYKEYVRLINKENGGHGSAINKGIQEAKGKYFKVIDADDWVNTENLVRLTSDLGNIDVDLVVNPYVTIDQQTKREHFCSYEFINGNLPEGAFKTVLEKYIRLALHSVTYRTSILRDNNITVTEKCFYEDFQYVLYPMPYIKTMTILSYPVYWYLIGQKSQSVHAVNTLKNVEMYYKVFCDSVCFYEEHLPYDSAEVDNYIQYNILLFLRSLYNIYLRNGNVKRIKKMMNEMDERVRKVSPFFYDQVAKEFFYIRLLRANKGILFKPLSFAMKIYKKMD